MDYQFREIEKNWQKFWADNKTYQVQNYSDKPKYYVLDMFPYPSGAGLHVGHPLGYIASDIFARYKRLKGFNVLHPMGYDSFGLPAEQYAIQTGQHPAITTETNIATYRKQLDQLGFSFDWDREVRTSDPDYYRWTQWIFMQLFNSWYNKDTDKAEPIAKLVESFERNGTTGIHAVCDDDIRTFTSNEWKEFSEEAKQEELLKYRLTYLKESTVNWCAALGTVLANDEVKDGFSERGGHPVEQKKMMQWSMRITAYADRLLTGLDTINWPEPLKEMQRNWIGKSVGALVKFNLTPSGGEGAEISNGEEARKGYQTANPAIWDILKQNARANRKEQTDAEIALWSVLRNNQTGHKIRRQHPIDSYIADFICIRKSLIIEVDGKYHHSIAESDKIRTEALNELGFKVIRFSNEEVIDNPDAIANKIKIQLDELPDRNIGNLDSLSLGEGRGEAIEVFTTRVDTLFGVSFLVIAPEHELVKQLTTPKQQQEIENYIAQTKKKSELDRMADTKTVSGAFTGSYALHPITNENIPVWIADYVLAGYGTGAVMAVPSGDQRDWLFAKKFNLPITQILDAQQHLETEADSTKEGTYINSDLINGLTYAEAIPKLIAKLEELGAGKAKINYRLRDAVFGRQRYWGEPVPVYFKNGLPHLIEESELPLILPEVDKYLPTESGEPPLGRAEGWKYTAPPQPSAEGRGPGAYREQSDLGIYKHLKEYSRENRGNPTEAEAILWEFLRKEKTGYKFRRQHAVDTFIADFACLEKGLIIEVDGNHHLNIIEEDKSRTEQLERYGFEVIRFSNTEVIANSERVFGIIKNKLIAMHPRKVLPTGEDLGGAVEYAYELSTMPGWAGSSWYWYRYMASPEERKENAFAPEKAIEYWKAVDLYIGGSEHATGHLLYSRFWNKFLKDIGYVVEEEPFKKLINQGMIQGRSNFVYRLIDEEGRPTKKFISNGLKNNYTTSAMHVDVNIVENDILDIQKFRSSREEYSDAEFILENGKYICGVEVEKMSKSKFNVVNPDDIIERYGADTLRMYEMFLGPLEQAKPWNTNGIEGVFKFLRKFWKLFHDDKFNFSVSDTEPTKAELKALHKIIKKVEEDVERFSFNTSVSSFMIAVNELTDLKCNKRSLLQDLVIILQPYAPHITEELWELLGNPAGTLSKATFPVFNAEYLVENEFSYPISINGKMKMNLSISLALEVAEVEKVVLENADVQRYLDGKQPKKVIVVKGKIVNLVV